MARRCSFEPVHITDGLAALVQNLRSSRRVYQTGILLRCIISLLYLYSAVQPARAQSALATPTQSTVVVPNANETTSGASGVIPFQGRDVRTLAVYSGAEFLSAMPSGGIINQIAFRLDEEVRGQVRTFDMNDLEIRMSTSPSLATMVPSMRFSDNIGPDETIVLSRSAALHWESRPTSSGPNNFDLVINLQTPFQYDPNKGSLAIDLLTHGLHLPSPTVDAQREGIPKNFFALNSGLGAETSDFFPAPVLRIGFSPVPEPNTCTLLFSGVVCLAVFKRIKRK